MTTTYSAAVRPTAPEEHHTVPLAPGRRPPADHPHRRLYTVSAVLGGCGILTLVIYITSATEMHPVPRTLLACLVTALIALAGVALMLGYSVSTRADEAQALLSQAARTAACQAEQQQTVVGMLGQVSTGLGDLKQVLGDRLDRVEQRQDEQDEEYERGWVDGAHRTAEALAPGNGNGHGQVRQLKPSSTPPRRPTR